MGPGCFDAGQGSFAAIPAHGTGFHPETPDL